MEQHYWLAVCCITEQVAPFGRDNIVIAYFSCSGSYVNSTFDANFLIDILLLKVFH